MKITCSGKLVELELLSTPIEIPTTCPECSSTLVKDGAHIFCKNEMCVGQQFRRLKTWVNKRNLKFLGDTLLTELYENHGIKEPWQLYILSEDDLAKCKRGNGVVGSSAILIKSEIDKSREATLPEFLGSLAIPMIGRRQVEIMQQTCGFTTLSDFLNATVEQLEAVEGFSIGGSKASTIVNGLNDSRALIESMLEYVKIIDDKPIKSVEISNSKLAGLTFCFTGALPSGMKRNDAEAMVTAAGGVARDSVFKGLSYLVIADPNSTSSKAEKARKLGVKLISEEQFKEML